MDESGSRNECLAEQVAFQLRLGVLIRNSPGEEWRGASQREGTAFAKGLNQKELCASEEQSEQGKG